MIKAKMKKAFTLAEVLITLGIIGIVAALTIPALTANYRRKTVAAKLKKYSSTMQNALNIAVSKEWTSDTWTMPTARGQKEVNEFVDTYIFPNLTGIKKCSAGDNDTLCRQVITNFQHNPSSGVIPAYIFLDGGCFIAMIGGCSDNTCLIHFKYDYNCLGKPNEEDRDIFAFTIRRSESGIYRWNSGGNGAKPNSRREYLLRLCKTHSEGACTALIEQDGWVISKDYPFKI